MKELNKVISALECCLDAGMCIEKCCPYSDIIGKTDIPCYDLVKIDAIVLLKEYRAAKVSGRCF